LRDRSRGLHFRTSAVGGLAAGRTRLKWTNFSPKRAALPRQSIVLCGDILIGEGGLQGSKRKHHNRQPIIENVKKAGISRLDRALAGQSFDWFPSQKQAM
jgi:hypothetical protein